VPCIRRIAIIAATAAVLFAPAASASGNGIAYDEINILYVQTAKAPPPPPGSFDAIGASLGPQNVPTRDPWLLSGPPVESLGNIGRLEGGVLLHYAFLNERWRVDDFASQGATIARPDRGEVVYLDLAAKKYRIVTGDEAKAIIAPPDAKSVLAAVQGSERDGVHANAATETISITTTVAPLDSLMIDGVLAPGRKVTIVSKGATTSSACPQVDRSETLTSYVDPTHDAPSFSSPFAAAENIMSALSLGECRFVVARSPKALPALPNQGRLALYARPETRDVYSSQAAPLVGTALTVRGHVRDLGPADESLFEIPAGFTAIAPFPARTPPATPSSPAGSSASR
jgi:hypothetical protein